MRCALVAAAVALGVEAAPAADPPQDPSTIESLTPEQARRLAAEFPGAEVQVKESQGTVTHNFCLPLPRLRSIDVETARALVGYRRGPLVLGGLVTLDADVAKVLATFRGGYLMLHGLKTLDVGAARVLAASQYWDGLLPSLTAFESPDSIDIAKALAKRKLPLFVPHLRKISAKTLTALIEKRDVGIPLLESLELIPEPDGSPTDDFVIPDWLEQKQRRIREEPAGKAR